MAEFRDNSDQDIVDSRTVPEPQCGTSDLSMTVPRELCSLSHDRRKKLVLHIDLNNTILISDAVTRQGTVAALDYFLTTVTWGRMNERGTGNSNNVTTEQHSASLFYLEIRAIWSYVMRGLFGYRSHLDMTQLLSFFLFFFFFKGCPKVKNYASSTRSYICLPNSIIADDY